MAFLNWSFNLNTGIKQVDEEHILLVNSINDLHESYQTGDVNLVKAAYQKMLDITIMHSRTSSFHPHKSICPPLSIRPAQTVTRARVLT